MLCVWAYLNYLSNWFLQYWINDYDDKKDTMTFTGMCLLILEGSNVARVARSVILMVGTTDATRIVNFEMLYSLGHASLSKFFDKVPIGRVLNRFSKDTQVVDLNLFNQIDKSMILL